MEKIMISFKPWFFSHGLKILGILLAAYLLRKILKSVIRKLVRKTVQVKNISQKEIDEKRENTLVMILDKTLRVVIWLIAGLMIISEFGVQIGPMIAAAGVVGLAVGFGSQYLIRDLVAGIFIILENQYRVGDAVCLDGVCGKVEEITLRVTTIRDKENTIHFFPNGGIKNISNSSK